MSAPSLTLDYLKMAVAFCFGFLLLVTAGFQYGRDEAKNPNYTRDALLTAMVIGATSIGCCMGALIFIHKVSIGQIIG
jgi:hypothetical protein